MIGKNRCDVCYGQAKRRQRELHAELEDELTLQRELGGGSRHQLSQLEREMREAEQEAADERFF